MYVLNMYMLLIPVYFFFFCFYLVYIHSFIQTYN